RGRKIPDEASTNVARECTISDARRLYTSGSTVILFRRKLTMKRIVQGTFAVVVATLCAAVTLAAQAPGRAGGPAPKSDWPPEGPTPRTADGKPDLSGNWQPNAIRQNVDLVGSGVEVPLLPAAAAVYKNHKDNISRDDPEARCLPPGVPRM